MTTTCEQLVTASDAARILNVGVSTVIRWIAAGDLCPVGKLQGQRGAWLLNISDVYALAERRRAEMLSRLPETTPRSRAAEGVA